MLDLTLTTRTKLYASDLQGSKRESAKESATACLEAEPRVQAAASGACVS